PAPPPQELPGATLADAGKNPSLVLRGTPGRDLITILSRDRGRRLVVEIVQLSGGKFHLRRSFPAGKLKNIIVYGRGGKDVLRVARDVNVPALVRGGSVRRLAAEAAPKARHPATRSAAIDLTTLEAVAVFFLTLSELMRQSR